MLKRITALILCATLSLCLSLPQGGASAEGVVQSVRILLTRLALTDRADLILDGLYVCETDGTAIGFPRGSSVTVSIEAGQLYVYSNGISVQAGQRAKFVRQASNGKGCLRFVRGGAYYPGDLELTLSGGMLQPVLTIPVEDYLLGVVPYEMNDSFPLEALKAQAVCARTYALSHINSARAWDMVDNTNDQVFRGVSDSNERAARAVAETCGIVGMYRGRLASCYYAASNGGQTELAENVWSGKDEKGLYAVTDDPYDLENPESPVRRVRLRKDGRDIPEAMLSLLHEQLLPALRRQGYDTALTSFRVDAVEAVTLGTPRYGAASRLMTTMELTFRYSGKKWEKPLSVEMDMEEISLFETPAPSATITPQPTAQPTLSLSTFLPAESSVRVTLPVFPRVVRALGLSIYGADNELITVREEGDVFLLESRRFGHGVGMSQRGAQWMALRYGKTFDQILAFYYPGMQLMVGGTVSAALPTPADALFATPGPSASPTPRPTLMPVTGALPAGAWLASVEGVAEDSSLNLRAGPSSADPILMRLYPHQKLIVLAACEDPLWVRVRTDVIEGYVMVGFLERVDQATTTPQP